MSEHSQRQVLTPAQAAALLGVSKTTVVSWCAKGILPALRIESRWWLKRPELVAGGWLEAGANGAAGVDDVGAPS